MYEIKPAQLSQVNEACALYNAAIVYFKENNINQWQCVGPNAESFKRDVENGECFVVLHNGKVAAAFMYSEKTEQTYANIYKGKWHISGEYAVIHRVAVSTAHKGRGIMAQITAFAAKKAKAGGKAALRCDTHADNKPMQRALTKNGFEYSGIIFLDENKTDERLVYELKL